MRCAYCTSPISPDRQVVLENLVYHRGCFEQFDHWYRTNATKLATKGLPTSIHVFRKGDRWFAQWKGHDSAVSGQTQLDAMRSLIGFHQGGGQNATPPGFV